MWHCRKMLGIKLVDKVTDKSMQLVNNENRKKSVESYKKKDETLVMHPGLLT